MMRNFLISLLVLLIAVAVLIPVSYGANTVAETSVDGSKASTHPWYHWWTMSFDTTGTLCVDTSTSSRIFLYTAKTGTVVYDIEGAIVNPPSTEATQSLDLANGSDLSAGTLQVYTTLVPYFCIRLSTCTTCTLTATILEGAGR